MLSALVLYLIGNYSDFCKSKSSRYTCKTYMGFAKNSSASLPCDKDRLETWVALSSKTLKFWKMEIIICYRFEFRYICILSTPELYYFFPNLLLLQIYTLNYLDCFDFPQKEIVCSHDTLLQLEIAPRFGVLRRTSCF